MSAGHKKIALIVAAVVGAYLVYRHVSAGSQTATASPGASSSDPASADYASLAGQEQGDVAGLQGGLNTLTGQEQSDMATLAAQEQGDVGNLSGQLGGLGQSILGLYGQVQALQSNTGNHNAAAVASGHKPPNRGRDTRKKKIHDRHSAKNRHERKQRSQTHHSPHVHASPNVHVAPAHHGPKPSHPAAKPKATKPHRATRPQHHGTRRKGP